MNRSGWLSRTSSQSSGVETRASGSGRIEYADATVRSFAFWLKSTKTLSPRSSFHQRAVARPGARNSVSRASVSAASRTSRKVQRGSMRTLMCMPRDPEVFGQPTSPWSASTSRTTMATSTIWLQSTPGIGSRSTRSSSGWSRSSARTGCGLRSMQPRFTTQASAAASRTTTSSAELPDA